MGASPHRLERKNRCVTKLFCSETKHTLTNRSRTNMYYKNRYNLPFRNKKPLSMRTTPKWTNGQDGRWRIFFTIKPKHKQAHTRTQTKTREISGIIVGLEAQFVVRAKERVFRLGLRFPVGLHSVLSKTPSGELTLRWPRRPSPPRIENLESVKSKVCKQTLFLDSTSKS